MKKILLTLFFILFIVSMAFPQATVIPQAIDVDITDDKDLFLSSEVESALQELGDGFTYANMTINGTLCFGAIHCVTWDEDNLYFSVNGVLRHTMTSIQAPSVRVLVEIEGEQVQIGGADVQI